MKKHQFHLTILILLFSLFLLVGCSRQEEKLTDKVKSEIDYFSTKIINILNKLNNITMVNYKVVSENINLSKDSAEYEKDSNSDEEKSNDTAQVQSSKDTDNIIIFQMSPNTILNPIKKDINWKELKNEIENIYSSWNTFLLDLYELEIPGDDILGFSRDLDIVTTYIKKEDKANSLLAMANLYKYLPRYAENIRENKIEANILKTKSYIINSYVLLDIDDWNGMEEEMSKAIDAFKILASDPNFISKNLYRSNKIYVLLNEIKNSLDLKDKEIFYIKYKNLMEELIEI